jgi:hypothetical protein
MCNAVRKIFSVSKEDILKAEAKEKRGTRSGRRRGPESTGMASLSELSKRLAQELDSLPDHQGIVDVFDYLAGAVYSLNRPEAQSLWNRKRGRLPSYKKRVSLYLSEIPGGVDPNPLWTGGYFLNSAMLRIAACYDRIPKLSLSRTRGKKGCAHSRMESFLVKGKNCPAWRAVYDEVNNLKHTPEGLASGRNVTKDQVIEALAEIVSALEEKRGELSKLA